MMFSIINHNSILNLMIFGMKRHKSDKIWQGTSIKSTWFATIKCSIKSYLTWNRQQQIVHKMSHIAQAVSNVKEWRDKLLLHCIYQTYTVVTFYIVYTHILILWSPSIFIWSFTFTINEQKHYRWFFEYPTPMLLGICFWMKSSPMQEINR